MVNNGHGHRRKFANQYWVGEYLGEPPSMKFNRVPHTKNRFNSWYIPSSGNIEPRMFFVVYCNPLSGEYHEKDDD